MSNNYIVAGDLNAYAMEDPVTTVLAAGFSSATDLSNEYTFVFDGQWGLLDYILYSGSTLSLVDSGIWHCNSDEPDYFDYNTNFRGDPPTNPFDGTDPYRFSDHDPVIATFMLT